MVLAAAFPMFEGAVAQNAAARDSAWCHDPIMSLHRSIDSDEEDGDEHPERPARTEGIVALATSQSMLHYSALIRAEHGLATRLRRLRCREVRREEVELAHSSRHWEQFVSLDGTQARCDL